MSSTLHPTPHHADRPQRSTHRASRSAPVLRWSLAALGAVVGAAAVYGGVGLIATGLQMPQEWLDATPFDTWTLPGGALLVTVAVPQLALAVLAALDHRWAVPAGYLMGFGLVAWIAVQLIVIQRFFFLQPVIAGIGIAEMAITWWWARRR